MVLGCTHYPLLSGVIQLAMGDEVTLVSSAEETAKDVYKVLADRDLLAAPAPELLEVLADRALTLDEALAALAEG